MLGDYNTEREVWIATAGLSKKALKKEIEKDTGVDQAEEFHQLMWFFQNIEDTFSGIGVKLKIFVDCQGNLNTFFCFLQIEMNSLEFLDFLLPYLFSHLELDTFNRVPAGTQQPAMQFC